MNKVVVFRPTVERNTIFGKLSRGPGSKRRLQMRLASEITRSPVSSPVGSMAEFFSNLLARKAASSYPSDALPRVFC